MGYYFSSCGSFRRLQLQRRVYSMSSVHGNIWTFVDNDHLHDRHHQAKQEPLAECKSLLHTSVRCRDAVFRDRDAAILKAGRRNRTKSAKST